MLSTATLPPLTRSLYVFAALCLFSLLVRGQTFGNPLIGYDEQFYLLVGDRMLHGALPYVDIFDRKPIGLFLIYAAIRKLGGDGFLQYQLVACGFVAATAYLIYRAARPISSSFAGIVSACLYVIWLNFLEGEGGQSELLFNLPMTGAALLTWRAFDTKQNILTLGAAAMLLVGIAMQIKYTTIIEGIFFGLTLLWLRYQSFGRFAKLWWPAIVWISMAIAPTLVAALIYLRLGALKAFIFANFYSNFGRVADPSSAVFTGLAEIVGVLLILAAVAFLRAHMAITKGRFETYWLLAAVLGFLVFKSFLTLHYAIPLLPPLVIFIAPYFARARYGRPLGVVLLCFGILGSQLALAQATFIKGDRGAAQVITKAARPKYGCIFVYDGYPALYMLTGSCLPTRWAFPGHLNSSNEASVAALGVDPTRELKRILAARPEVIVDDAPVYYLANLRNHNLVQQALARNYQLTLRYRTGHNRYRLVYHLKTSGRVG